MPTRVTRDPPKGQGPGAQRSLLPRLRLPPCLLLKARAEVLQRWKTMRIYVDKLPPMWKWLKNKAPITAMRLRSAQRVTTHDDVLGDERGSTSLGEDDARVSLLRLGGATDWVRHQQAWCSHDVALMPRRRLPVIVSAGRSVGSESARLPSCERH